MQSRSLMTETGNCFNQVGIDPFPQIIGGWNGITTLSCLAIDGVNKKILVTGYSASNDVSSSGAFTTYEYSDCTIQEGTKTYFIAVAPDPGFQILIVQYSTGAFEQVFYELDGALGNLISQRRLMGVAMSSASIIYLTTAYGDNVFISAFQYASGSSNIAPIFQKKYGYTSYMFSGMIAKYDLSNNRMYFGGSYLQRPCILGISLTTGIYQTFVRFDATNANPSGEYLIKKIGLNHNTDVFQITCIESIGATGSMLGFVLFKDVGGTSNTPQRGWYYDQPDTMYCIDVQLSTTQFTFLYSQTNTDTFTSCGAVTLNAGSSPQTTVRIIRTLSAIPNKYYPSNGHADPSGFNVYEIGSLKAINSDTYFQNAGFINKWPKSSTSCLTQTEQYDTMTLDFQTDFVTAGGFYSSVDTALVPFSVNLTNQFRIYSTASYNSAAPPEVTLSSLLSLNAVELPATCLAYSYGGITTSPLANITYIVGQANQTSTASGFTYSKTCTETLVWVYYALLQNGSALPNFITFTGVHPTLTVTVYTTNSAHAGTYVVVVFGALNGGPNKQIIITVTINAGTTTNTSPPFFRKSFQDYILMQTGTIESIALPQIIDDQDSDQVTVSLQNQKGPSAVPAFIQLRNNQIRLTPQSGDAGVYKIVVILNDNHSGGSLETSYMLVIQVYRSQLTRDKNKPVIKIDPKNDQVNDTERLNATISDNMMKILSIDSNGKLKIKLNEDLSNNIDPKILVKFIRLYLNDDSNEQLLKFDFVKYQDRVLTLQLLFQDKSSVSMTQKRDKLIMKVQQENQKDYLAQKEIPPQSNQNSDNILDQTNDVLQITLNSILYGSMGLSIFLGNFMQLLWGMINTLQLASHTPLFTINYSAEVNEFLKAIFDVSTFDPIESNQYIQRVFKLEDIENYPPYNDRFEFTGYDSSNFLYLLGGFPVLFIFKYLLILIIYLSFNLTIVALQLKSQKIKKRQYSLYYHQSFSIGLRVYSKD
eukprot:403354665